MKEIKYNVVFCDVQFIEQIVAENLTKTEALELSKTLTDKVINQGHGLRWYEARIQIND
jgi:hypothetical protein